MKLKIISAPALATAFVALVWMLIAAGPYMRETDQAWLVDGGLDIANGHADLARSDFNFDKQFVCYYLVGLVFKCLPHPFQPDELVLAGNLLGMILFWGSLFVLVAASARRLPFCALVAVLLTPCFLVFSPFLATSFISVSFVLLLAFILGRNPGCMLTGILAFLLSFCAVGARTDAIFLLPLLAMLHSRRPDFISVLKNPATWLMAAGGLTAFFLGRRLYLQPIMDYAAIPFHPKIVATYVVFGLGATSLLLIISWISVLATRKQVRSGLWLTFLGLGLLLPAGYSSLQLLTPRHCTVSAISVVVFLCAQRGRIMLQNFLRGPVQGMLIKAVLVIAAVLPLFVGVNVQDLNHPYLTLAHPTLLPTGAGVAPAGAYLAFGKSFRQGDGILDHNQAIWVAAKSTQFAAGPDGIVHYLSSPVDPYLKAAIHIQGKNPAAFAVGHLPWPENFYAESRSLMRYQFVFPADEMNLNDFFTRASLAPATQFDWHGITVLKTVPRTEDTTFMGRLWALNMAFGPDEFRRQPVETLRSIPEEMTGEKLMLVSREKFNVSTTLPAKYATVAHPTLGSWNLCVIDPLQAGLKIGLMGTGPEQVVMATGVFPEWMSPPENADVIAIPHRGWHPFSLIQNST